MASELVSSPVNSTIKLFPVEGNASSSPDAPTCIILFSWMDALPKHVLKYANEYRQMYSGANIITVASESADWTYRSFSAQKANIEPLLPLLAPDENSDRLLVHLFSNGGALNLLHLSDLYRERHRRSLPIQAVVLDSVPGRFDIPRGYKTMTMGLPQSGIMYPLWNLTLGPVILASFVFSWAFLPDVFELIRKSLNDGQTIPRTAPRLYIWTTKDAVVDHKAVEAHVEDAKQHGYVVKTLRFENGSHVGHLRNNAAEYWQAVQKLWRSRSSL